MKIKLSKRKSPLIEYPASFLSSYLRRHRMQFLILAVFMYSLLIFLGGILVHKSGVIEEVIKPSIKKKRVFLKHVARGAFLARPRHITIDIKYTDFQKLEYKRREALALNLLMKDDTDYVPAEIRYNGKALRASLRLKGDHTDHLETNKWSFRIKLRGNDTLFGMRSFSIQHPKTRNYIYEWLYHKALKREGLVSLRYDFIDVTLNGKDMGIYAIEEFFDKRLIEHNEYREGPIVRFGEDMMWNELLQRGEVVNSGTYLSSPIDAFQTNRTLQDKGLREEFIKAISLLELFRKGELKTSDVFDVRKLATFFAISDLMGAEHATAWINMRLYYNPVTSRLEPIGFDATCTPIQNLCLKPLYGSYAPKGTGRVLESLYTALTMDRAFFKEYVKELERISGPSYLENFFNEIEDELEKKLDILYKEFPYYNFSKDVFYHNQHIINVTLNPVKVLNVYFNNAQDDGIELELGSVQSMDAEVIGAYYKDSVLLNPSEKIILAGKLPSEPVAYQNMRFLFPEGFIWDDTKIADVKLHCRIFGTSRDRYEDVFPFPHIDKYYVENDFVRERPNIGDFEFIALDENTKKIFIKQGEWNISQNLIIPKGYTVICHENTKINLLDKAKLLSFSPFNFIGSEDYPVVIYSSDSTGEGIIVMAEGGRSILKYVVFKNLGEPQQAGWKLTGAVTFYESPVDIYNCQFIDNRSEDGLNIIRSEFNIDGELFKNTFSDAFDADFGKGRIVNSSFIHCGNDAIDVSGTVVFVKDVFIEGAGDKGISCGEISNVTAEGIDVKNSNIAAASKDLSVLNINNITISSCKIGFTVYQKKPEYGPARLEIENLKARDIQKMYMIEEGSSASIDKAEIAPNEKDVYKLLYGDAE